VPAKYILWLLTAERQQHCLYLDSDFLDRAKDNKNIKILLLEIKRQCLLLFQSARYCAMKKVKAKLYIGIFMYEC